MKYSSIPSAQSVVLHCKAKGIRDLVISPGSRNAPLTIGFTSDDYFNCYSMVDERSAAFFALGMAQQLQRPVAVLCTSGSALLNYYPAVAEAFFSGIPLVVISADRPFYKIDVGDGQTIRQDHVFDRHIGYSANLRQDACHATHKIQKYAPKYLEGKDASFVQSDIQAYNDGELNKALNLALGQKLPVHINVPFEEPLYDRQLHVLKKPQLDFIIEPDNGLHVDLEAVKAIWRSSKRKMVLIGVNFPNTVEQKYLDILAEDPSVIVLTETTSNLNHSKFFPSIDSLIAPLEKLDSRDEFFEKLRPEVLLTLGGLVVSKKIKALLRNFSPTYHWHIDPYRANDTFFSLSEHFKTNPNTFFNRFLNKAEHAKSDYFSFWNTIKENYVKQRGLYLSQIAFSDLKAFQLIFEHMPKLIQLQLANSSTIRYAQLLDIDPSVRVFCNRGTSGIDGSTSTAIGASLAHKHPTVLITGDLSFFYDSNALWNTYLKTDLKIIVINNSGGGIFRILPGKEETKNFETYFETTHQLNASHLCKTFDIDYQSVNNENALSSVLPEFFSESGKAKLLEVSTPRLSNNKILLGYFDFISSTIINHKL